MHIKSSEPQTGGHLLGSGKMFERRKLRGQAKVARTKFTLLSGLAAVMANLRTKIDGSRLFWERTWRMSASEKIGVRAPSSLNTCMGHG